MAATTLTFNAQPQVNLDIPHDLHAAHTHGELLRVQVGSRLHGFATPNSDYDYWVVVREPRDHTHTLAARRVHQTIATIEDDTVIDVTIIGLSTFMRYASNGTPQALEALYAPQPELDNLGPMRHMFRPSPQAAIMSYRRMLSRVVNERATDPKQRRHGARMALNLDCLLKHGRFNPTLTASQRDWVHTMSHNEDGYADRLRNYVGYSLD